jgi:hypothetical protein
VVRIGYTTREIRADVNESAERERERIRGEERLEGRLSRAFGIITTAIGLLLVVVGGLSPSYAGPAGEIGLVFGVVGYLLGARRLGGTVVVVSVAEIVVGLLG